MLSCVGYSRDEKPGNLQIVIGLALIDGTTILKTNNRTLRDAEVGGDPVTPADVDEHGVVTRLPRWQPWAKAAMERLEQLRHAG